MLAAAPKSLRDLLVLTLLGLIAFLPGIASIPPIDRDESRYVQATVQMIETDDFIDIRFQDQARHKKPAGAYWAQVASLGLSGKIDDVKRGERAVWAHRLPSTLGALIAVWATYLSGAALFGRREAFIGAGLLALSVSLSFEAHIAKTDAMLAGASAVVLYGVAMRKAWPTWLGLAFGMLLKGPILLGLVILTLVVDAAASRSMGRIKSVLRPLPIGVALLIAVPWFVAIGLQTDGAFFAEALGRDFAGKIAGAQETHGGLPGYYGLTTLFMFWPGILALPVAAVFAWRNKTDATVRLLLAWLVPLWILLEIVPTKLPHYTLILYPALALLAGAAWVRILDAPKSRIAGLFIALLVGSLLIIGVTATHWSALPATVLIGIGLGLLALILLSGAFLIRGRETAAFGCVAVFLATVYGGVLAHSPAFNLTPRLVAQLPNDAPIASPDYREPSFVFLTNTQTQVDNRVVKPGDTLILNADTPAPACASLASSVSGLHYAKGREVTLNIYQTQPCNVSELSTWAALP